MGVMTTPAAAPRPVRPSVSNAVGVPNADGLCCYRVWDVHELHNERWYEYRDYLTFLVSQDVWDLPDNLRDGVQFDLEFSVWDHKDTYPSFTEMLDSDTLKRYQADIAKRGEPVFVPVDEAKTSYTVLTRETDPAVVSEMCYAANHHYQIVGVEPCEYDPNARVLED